jgi:hypothetical protein
VLIGVRYDCIYARFDWATFGRGLLPHCQAPPRKTNCYRRNDSGPARSNCDPFGAARRTREIQSSLTLLKFTPAVSRLYETRFTGYDFNGPLFFRGIPTVEASEQARADHRHEQRSQSHDCRLDWIPQVEIADLADEQIADCDIEGSP